MINPILGGLDNLLGVQEEDRSIRIAIVVVLITIILLILFLLNKYSPSSTFGGLVYITGIAFVVSILGILVIEAFQL